MEAWQFSTRRIGDLSPHPKNEGIFGPASQAAIDELRRSIERFGLQEPPVITESGVVLSGHLRRLALLQDLGADHEVSVRIHPPFASEREELEFVIEMNVRRRQLTPAQIGRAFRELTRLYPAEGGVRGRRGRPRKGSENAPAPGRNSPALSARDRAAKTLGVGRDMAEALATVFTTDGVPGSIQEAVEQATLAPTVAAKAIRQEVQAQGGTLQEPDRVVARVEAAGATRTASEKVDRLGAYVRSLGEKLAPPDEEVQSCVEALLRLAEDATRVAEALGRRLTPQGEVPCADDPGPRASPPSA